jgi:Ni,Fe-hydrogenase I cytochrome b subunit
MTAVDPEYQRHYQFWIGFTRFMKIGIAFVVTLLILMAIFLV